MRRYSDECELALSSQESSLAELSKMSDAGSAGRRYAGTKYFRFFMSHTVTMSCIIPVRVSIWS